MRFPIVIHKDEDSSYGVTVPDLPGCFSGAETLDEAFENAQEAILLHLEGMMADGEVLPKIQPVQAHIDGEFGEDYVDGTWGYVNVSLDDIAPDKAKNVNITLPSRTLAVIDRQAKREEETRSGFLTKTALEYIGRLPN